MVCDKANSFTFNISEEARILNIHNITDVKKLPLLRFADEELNELNILSQKTGIASYDWEKIAKNYDLVDFRISKDFRLYHEMYGWDCDSVLILNPSVIII